MWFPEVNIGLSYAFCIEWKIYFNYSTLAWIVSLNLPAEYYQLVLASVFMLEDVHIHYQISLAQQSLELNAAHKVSLCHSEMH